MKIANYLEKISQKYKTVMKNPSSYLSTDIRNVTDAEIIMENMNQSQSYRAQF